MSAATFVHSMSAVLEGKAQPELRFARDNFFTCKWTPEDARAYLIEGCSKVLARV